MKAKWFRRLGECQSCQRPATGHLMSNTNAEIGRFCTPCADKRLKKDREAS